MKGKSLIESIGNTPMVELCNINPNPHVRILAKLEGNNPGGSVKDRPARQMILAAEKSGELTHDKIILEPTSGNTGIALAMIAAARGYRIKLAMPACVSVERRSVLEAYGAEIELSPGYEATDGAIRLAHKIHEENPDTYYMPNQYANPNNVLAHYETTGPEIMRQTGGEVTHFVAGMGTGGTLMGTARFFGEANRRSGSSASNQCWVTRSRGSRTCRRPSFRPSTTKGRCHEKSPSRMIPPLKPPDCWRPRKASSAACPVVQPWQVPSDWLPNWIPARSW